MVDFWIILNQTPPKEAPMCRELPQVEEENILEEIVIVMVIENFIETKDPWKRSISKWKAPDRGGHLDRGEYPNRGGRPPGREDTL